MRPLPVELTTEYRLATSHIIRSWSFGALKSVRTVADGAWKHRRSTLQDEAIFGPTRDFECACGKYSGKRYEKMICDVCGVKITTATSRRTRFGHIELPVPEPHPFGGPADALEAFPVLPAAFMESVAGSPLADLYDSLLTASAEHRQSDVHLSVTRIVEFLLPIAVEAQRWNLQDAVTFARGIALERLDASEAGNDRCETCGYAIGGLDVSACPGCGRRLRG